MDLFSLSQFLDLWHQVEHIGALTGLSAGALILCGIALYFGWQISIVRHVAIAIVAATVVGYVVGLRAYEVGRADVKAEWDAANDKAKADAIARDASIAVSIEQKYAPVIAGLKRQSTRNQKDERNIVAAIAAAPGSCQLGDAVVRVRNASKRRQ